MHDERIARAESLAGLNRHEDVLQVLADPGLNSNPAAAQLRVFALLNLDRAPEAHNEATRLVGLDPDSPLSFLARSYSWESLERPWDALKDAREAARLAPYSPVVRSRLATCLARSGQLDEAHEEVGWVLAQEPDEPDHWVLLGRVYYHLNRFDEAEGALLEALRLDPESSEARVMLAGVQAESGGRKPESIENLIEVLKDNPTLSPVRQMLLEIAFPRQLPKELVIILFGLVVMLGSVVALVPIAISYGFLVAYRYRRLSPELQTLVLSDPDMRKRIRIAVAVWAVGTGAAIAGGLYLLLR